MRLESNTTYVPPMRLMYPAMGGVVFGLDSNEPVIAMQETYGRNKEGTGDHRYQVMILPRGNVACTFWTDLGPAENFNITVGENSYRTPAYFQLVLMEHSVAECMHMAEQGRNDDFAVKLLDEQVNESDLFEQYYRLIEEDLAIVRNRSVFGPGSSTQRSGYSAIAARMQQESING